MSRSPRNRRPLGLLAFAAAALVVVGCRLPMIVEFRQQGNPLTLDSSRAHEVIRFSVRLDSKTEISELVHDDRLVVDLKLSPADGVSGAAQGERLVIARLRRLDATTTEEKTLSTSDETRSQSSFQHEAFSTCGERICEGEFELALELLEPAGGPVRVDWSVAVTVEREPEESTLEIDLDA